MASMMADVGFAGLLKLISLFTVTTGVFGYVNKQLGMVKWLTHALAFVAMLSLPIVYVALTDKTGLEPPRVVDNVPFALAVTAQATNLMFSTLTSTYETVFDTLEGLGLQKGDMSLRHHILKQVSSATIRDPSLRSDLMQLIKEYTLYDVKNGEITPQQIVDDIDAWNAIFSNTSPARFVTYNTLTNAPITDTCTNVTVIPEEKVNDVVTAGQAFYSEQAFTRVSNDTIATSMSVSTVDTSCDQTLNNSNNASGAMKQAMLSNIWREAGTGLPMLLDDPARATEVNALADAV